MGVVVLKTYLIAAALAVLSVGCSSSHDKTMSCIADANKQMAQGDTFEDAALHDKAQAEYQSAMLAADGCASNATTTADTAEVSLAQASAHTRVATIIVENAADSNSPLVDDAAKQSAMAERLVLGSCSNQSLLSDDSKKTLRNLLPRYVTLNNDFRTKLEGKTFTPDIPIGANLKDACAVLFKLVLTP